MIVIIMIIIIIKRGNSVGDLSTDVAMARKARKALFSKLCSLYSFAVFIYLFAVFIY